MRSPLVSVVTATMAGFRLERRRGLEEVWDDLRAQVLQDWEWIVVTDGPCEGLTSWAQRLDDPRVRLIGSPASHEQYKKARKHYGGYVQKAAGVRAARGTYVVHVDDDNRICPSYLQRMAAEMQQHDLQFCLCWVKTDYASVPVLRPEPPFPPYTEHGCDVLCMMILRSVIEELGGWPEYGGAIEPQGNLGDDETLLRRIEHTCRYHVIPEVLGYHRTLAPDLSG